MTMTESTNAGYHHSPWSVPGERSSAFSGYNDSPGQEQMSPHKRESASSSPRHSGSNGYSSDQQSDTEDGPTYLLEHLATFTVGRTHSIMDPKDGLNKLWQMEKRTGIWTQKMQMRLLKQQVIIIDFENGDVVERFPMNLITSPMAYTGTDNKEPYNNILVFIVKEEPKAKNLNNSEMHIFQCVQVSAQVIVEDMKLFMTGKWKSPYKNDLPPPPNAPAPEPPMNGVVKNQVAAFNNQVPNPSMLRSSPAYNPRDSIDETSSTSSEKYEKEVGILNHCFDDIEQFIAWLQSAAAAFRELERRKKDRKNRRKDHGDGMLRMRAKPPPEHDFVDVLQKFKLSFNLLAKLKNHIHDPNAPELVHFLFTPLALIVDASQDSNYGPNMASRVVSPLLTKEAVELLGNCLTSKESDLWHSLGEPWVVSREQWTGSVDLYRPTFRDGYSPDYPFSDDKVRAETTANEAASAARARQAQHEVELRDKEYQRAVQEARSSFPGNYYRDAPDQPSSPEVHHRAPYPPANRDPRYVDRTPHTLPYEPEGGSVISADSIEGDPQRDFEHHQQRWLEDLKARRAKIVQVIFPRTANNDKELSVFRGEYLEVVDDTRKWWKARNSRNQVAHVPHTIVTPYHMDDGPVFNNPLYDGPGRDNMYRQDSSRHSTDGSNSGDLNSPSRPPPNPPPAPVAPGSRGRRVLEETTKEREAPPEVKPKQIKKTTKPNAFDPESSEKLHDELKRTIGRKGRPGRYMPKAQLSPAQISDGSNEEEVQDFLRRKGFDESIQHILSEMNGYKLFHLTPEQLEKYCGKKEGTRLNGQLLLQKSLSGYSTMSAKELERILQKRFQKTEGQENFGKDDKTNGHEDKAEKRNSKRPPLPQAERHYSPSPLTTPEDSEEETTPKNKTSTAPIKQGHNRMQKMKPSIPPPPPPPPPM